ncbi:MAG TPA: DUF3307 domain-containing protein [Nocardioides sp.]|nr:DUF3307 domain-containing protein [Nocardioides sp.]
MTGVLTPLGILLAHCVGDYLVQTHHQAVEKTKRWLPALLHAATYTACYLPLTRSPLALLVIGGTHAVIDHYRLARYVVWFKNQFAPKVYRPPLTATGYPDDTPGWLAFGLLIVADNVLHLLINAASVVWLR